MKNIFKNEILLSFMIFLIIPLIMVLLDIKLSSYKNFNNLLFNYNSSSSIIFGYFLNNTSSIFLTIFLIIYNLWFSIFLYNISEFTKKYIIIISFIISILVAFIWLLLTTL